MQIELIFDVVPDEFGVIDGRKLAQELISAAYQILVPYVRGCPACADNLFSGIANQAIEELPCGRPENRWSTRWSLPVRRGRERHRQTYRSGERDHAGIA